jgi:hypothetical protein
MNVSSISMCTQWLRLLARWIAEPTFCKLSKSIQIITSKIFFNLRRQPKGRREGRSGVPSVSLKTDD